MDWYRSIIPGIVDLKGSYIMFDQGLTGITKAIFPTWIAMIFLTLYPVWFALGYETTKKYHLPVKYITVFMAGILILTIPSIMQSKLHLYQGI
jgi:hypothetical protein